MTTKSTATTSIEAGNLFNVNGLVAVITGGGTGKCFPSFFRSSNHVGIGLMMARALALNGASKVYIIGRRPAVLEEASKSIPTPGKIIPVVGDVTSFDSLTSIVSKIKAETGYINLLVANSGILGPRPPKAAPSIQSISEFQECFLGDSEGGGQKGFDAYVDTFRVNTAAVWYTIVHFLGLLDEGNKKGNVEMKSQVIATSSIGGYLRKVASGYAYGESKAAVSHMLLQLATGLAPFAIRANILAPGRK
jgi:NAD(P)-dependent dehydrogenase (short-subunit alcohol dehydrogenase family)